uniref:UDP-glycosyltransferase 83A1-like n=1 Tax=Ananas comosus var. bracteatus TaxID=296719 RepID=A0A6V7NLG9_ANACO|nr:unnamed protein product [Ananas comosus var. bracteatus]
MENSSHVVILPFPAQGHRDKYGLYSGRIGSGEDRNDLGRLTEGFTVVMPGHLEKLIREINDAEGESCKIKWMVADANMGWSFAVAKKMGIRAVSFWPPSAALLAFMLRIPSSLRMVATQEKRDNSTEPGMVPIETTEFSWNHIGDPKGQPIIFQLILQNNQATELADVIICNSFHEIEPATFALHPNILPIGPLMADQKFEKPIGHFWQEDMTCLHWLNEQPNNSVVYVAFGSFTVFDRIQLEELAHGLELTEQPFYGSDYIEGENKEKVEELLADEELKARACLWRDIAHRSINEGGSSYENFKKFVNIISQDH